MACPQLSPATRPPNVTSAKERYGRSDLPPLAQDGRQDRSDHHRDDEHVLGRIGDRIDDRWREEEQAIVLTTSPAPFDAYVLTFDKLGGPQSCDESGFRARKCTIRRAAGRVCRTSQTGRRPPEGEVFAPLFFSICAAVFVQGSAPRPTRGTSGSGRRPIDVCTWHIPDIGSGTVISNLSRGAPRAERVIRPPSTSPDSAHRICR